MEKKVLKRMGLIAAGIVVAVGAFWGYYTWNSQLDRDSRAAVREDKGAAKDIEKEVSKYVEFDMPSKEELNKFLDNLESRNGDMLPEGRYDAVVEEYGQKVADAYVAGYMISADMSEEEKEQMKRNIRSMADEKVIRGVPRYTVSNEMYEDVKSETTQVNVLSDDYFVDTKGFDVVNGWKVGYPSVKIQGISYALQLDNADVAQKYINHSLVSFYAFIDEDILLEDAIKQLSEFKVKVNGKEAKPAGTLVKNWGFEENVGVLPFALYEDEKVEGTTLIGKGMVEVAFEIENSAFFTDPKVFYDDKVDTLSLEVGGKKYSLTRDSAGFTDAPYMTYEVRE